MSNLGILPYATRLMDYLESCQSDGRCQKSLFELSDETGMHIRTVAKAEKALEAAGLIAVERSRGGKANIYWVHRGME